MLAPTKDTKKPRLSGVFERTHLPIFGGSRKAIAKNNVAIARVRMRTYAKLSIEGLLKGDQLRGVPAGGT